MPVALESHQIVGGSGQPVPYRILRQSERATHLAVILPGRGYTARMPLLYYATMLLLDRGADVLSIDWEYAGTLEQVQGWVAVDAADALAASLAGRVYTGLTLVGKSLGTLAMAHLIAHEPAAADSRLIWLTPPLGWEPVRDGVAATADRSLLVVGGADALSDSAIVAAHTGRKHVVPGGDHNLGIPGDVVRSVEALRGIVAAIDAYLA